jgi:hypothetical protein
VGARSPGAKEIAMRAAHVEYLPLTRERRLNLYSSAVSLARAEFAAAAERLRRASCGLSGHAMLLQFQPDRLSLKCQECGEETPGWAIGHH